TASAICAVKPASTASYSPASSRSSRVVAMAAGSTCTAAGAEGAACTGATIAVEASNTEPNAAWSSRRGISELLLEHQPDVVERRELRGRDQFPAEPAEPVELLADPLRHRRAHHVRGQFHHFVGPLLVHGVSSGSSGRGVCGNRPPLRSASSRTDSIWALTLRSSSSAQRCAAASTSALMRSA